MFKKTALLLAVLALSASSAFAITIADINSNGGIQVGDKWFSQFAVNGADESSVNVLTFVEAGAVGITFSGPFSVNTGVADFALQFKVDVTDPNYFITSIGQAIVAFVGNPTAEAKVDEQVWAGGFGLGTPLANSTVIAPGDVNDPVGEFSDMLVLSTASQSVYVQKDIFLNGGTVDDPGCIQIACQQGASATTITQRFYQTPGGDIPGVPEPATMLLFSTALLGLGFMRRKKS